MLLQNPSAQNTLLLLNFHILDNPNRLFYLSCTSGNFHAQQDLQNIRKSSSWLEMKRPRYVKIVLKDYYNPSAAIVMIK